MAKKNSRPPVVNPLFCVELCQVPTLLGSKDLEALAWQCVPTYYLNPLNKDNRVNVFVFKKSFGDEFIYYAFFVSFRNWLSSYKIRSFGLADSEFISAFPLHFDLKLNL